MPLQPSVPVQTLLSIAPELLFPKRLQGRMLTCCKPAAAAVLGAKKEEPKEQASVEGKVRRSTRPYEELENKEAPAQYHVLATVDGAIYTQWQIRICYFWYKRVKADSPGSALGGFTRLLHRCADLVWKM